MASRWNSSTVKAIFSDQFLNLVNLKNIGLNEKILFYDHFHLKEFLNTYNCNKVGNLIQGMLTAHSEDKYNSNYQNAVDILKTCDSGLSWIEEFHQKIIFFSYK